MREEVECSYCKTRTNRQPAGDGCHACSRGVMVPVAVTDRLYMVIQKEQDKRLLGK